MTDDHATQINAAEVALRETLREGMRQAGIPWHMREGVEAYVVYGRPTGDFLRAVLEDKLVMAFAKADDQNLLAMRAWAEFMYYHVPSVARGSSDAVEQWIALGGQRGAWYRQANLASARDA